MKSNGYCQREKLVLMSDQRSGQSASTLAGYLKGTSKNPILRAAALRLACLPRFVTIRRDSKKIIAYLSTICRAQIFYLCLVLPRNLNF